MYLKVGIIFQIKKESSSFRGLGSKIERKMTGGILASYNIQSSAYVFFETMEKQCAENSRFYVVEVQTF